MNGQLKKMSDGEEFFGDLERDYLKDYAYICAQKETENWKQWEEENKKQAVIKIIKEVEDDVTREVQTDN
jgi:hypothetical protein